jgi:hypothetical protein
VGVAVLMINSLPMISYGLPSFAPAWLTWVPSYPTVFAVRDVLFMGPGWQRSCRWCCTCGADLLAFAAAYAAIRYKLLKEGR